MMLTTKEDSRCARFNICNLQSQISNSIHYVIRIDYLLWQYWYASRCILNPTFPRKRGTVCRIEIALRNVAI